MKASASVQNIVIKKNIVNANDAVPAEINVVEKRRTRVEAHVETVMKVVIEIGSGGNDPIDQSGPHQGNDAGFAESRGGERAGEAQAHGTVVGQHLFDEQLRRLPDAARVVGHEGLINEIGRGDVAPDPKGVDARVGGEFSGRGAGAAHKQIRECQRVVREKIREAQMNPC